jgi:hypothetical protein
MKIYTHGPYNGVTKIEFCCDKIAEDVLLGRVGTRPWTDHPLVFWTKDGYRLLHCPSCGAKIEGECHD